MKPSTSYSTGQMRELKVWLSEDEKRQLAEALEAKRSEEYDQDARTLTSGCYLRSDMTPSYLDLQPTAIYKRGWELRQQDKETTSDTYEAGTKGFIAFRFAYGRGPAKGDVLRYDDVRFTFGPELQLLHLKIFISAWQRQLTMPCPLKVEGGRVFRRVTGYLRTDPPTWEEEMPRRDYEEWWRAIEREAGKEGICGVMFEDEGVRPATEEELSGPPVKSDRGLVGTLFKVVRTAEV